MIHVKDCVYHEEYGGCNCDGYHTWDELYEHRYQLFLALARVYGGWRSRYHADGSMYDGSFVAGLGSYTEKPQITYHFPMRLWDDAMGLTTLGYAPEWDGYTSQDVLERLKRLQR